MGTPMPSPQQRAEEDRDRHGGFVGHVVGLDHAHELRVIQAAGDELPEFVAMISAASTAKITPLAYSHAIEACMTALVVS